MILGLIPACGEHFHECSATIAVKRDCSRCREAIHKMTGMPAGRFGLTRRGRIREGYYADLVLFDPERISDMATFTDPIRPAVGIERVWVNGALSYTGRGRHAKPPRTVFASR